MDPQCHDPDPESATRGSQSSTRSPSGVADTLRRNLVMFPSKWAELNGAMGDLGTYIPIVLALTLAKNLDLGTTLIFTGVYNFITGAVYGVPMPVQPMKSIAAVAISDAGFGIPEVMAAGICTGATGLMKVVYKVVPIAVVRGIQLAQGLSFAMTAVKYVRKEQNFAKSKSGAERPWLGFDGLLLALLSACFIIIINGSGQDRHLQEDQQQDNRRRRWAKITKLMSSTPSAFTIFTVGLILAMIRGPKALQQFSVGPSKMQPMKISTHAWKQGFVKGTIPQLPLSILNSVIAVCKLSTDLFPDKTVSATSVSITVGLMNLTGCWLGAMPCCHGAGGLAGQYKFGGRSGGCVALLGLGKLVLGVLLGGSLLRILDQFPVGILGLLLLFAGIELAMCCRDMNSKEEAFVMLVCTAVSLVGSSAALGFLCGMLVWFLLRLRCVGEAESWSGFWSGRDD